MKASDYAACGLIMGLVGVMALPSLFWAWQTAPYDRGAGWVFGLWLLAGGGMAWAGRHHKPRRLWGAWLALVLAVVGRIAEVNAVLYWAWVCALLPWFPLRWTLGLWVVAAVSWMPAMGWILRHFSEATVLGCRWGLLLTAVAGLVAHGWWAKRREGA